MAKTPDSSPVDDAQPKRRLFSRKPKADKNKKVTGQTPKPVDGALAAVAGKSRGKT